MVKLRVYYTSLCVLAGPELAQLLDRDTHQLWSCLSDTSHSSEQVTRALTVWLWVSDRHAVMDSLGGGAQAVIQLDAYESLGMRLWGAPIDSIKAVKGLLKSASSTVSCLGMICCDCRVCGSVPFMT